MASAKAKNNMSKKIYLSLLSILFLFNVLSHGLSNIAEAVSNKFKYIGTDNHGGIWYLDTSSYKHYKYSEHGEIIDFDIMTETLRPYKEEIIGWLSEELRNKTKANNIYTQIATMSYHCMYSLENRKCRVNRIYFFNTQNKIVYSYSLGVTWHLAVQNSPIDIAINWIIQALGIEQTNSESRQTKELFNVLGMSFLIGVIILLIVIPFYIKSPVKNSNTTVIHNDIKGHDSNNKENISKDDFDYPYEDIGDALKQ